MTTGSVNNTTRNDNIACNTKLEVVVGVEIATDAVVASSSWASSSSSSCGSSSGGCRRSGRGGGGKY